MEDVRTDNIVAALTVRKRRCYHRTCSGTALASPGPRRLAWPRTSPFHGGNTGSNPVGDANLINNLRNCRLWRTTGYATVKLLNHTTMGTALLFRHSFVVDIHRD